MAGASHALETEARPKTRRNLRFWNIPVTTALDDAVEAAVQADMHVSKSDLIREAVREKLAKMGYPKPEVEEVGTR